MHVTKKDSSTDRRGLKGTKRATVLHVTMRESSIDRRGLKETEKKINCLACENKVRTAKTEKAFEMLKLYMPTHDSSEKRDSNTTWKLTSHFPSIARVLLYKEEQQRQ